MTMTWDEAVATLKKRHADLAARITRHLAVLALLRDKIRTHKDFGYLMSGLAGDLMAITDEGMEIQQAVEDQELET